MRYYRRRFSLILSIIAGLLLGHPAKAEPKFSRQIDSGRKLIRNLMKRQKIPGLAIAVWSKGRIVWSEGFGFADLEGRVAVTAETRFRIGSISKSLTAAAVGQLVEAKKLDLDAPVQKYVPAFPKKRFKITTRQLCGHLAGIRHYRGTEFLNRKNYLAVSDGLKIFSNDRLLHRPGTKYSYSSYGFNLVSAVVESASGQPFLLYMRKQVFDRLKMKNTVADRPSAIIPNRTRFYARSLLGQLVNAPSVNNSYKWAGGGFLSTPEDLCKFASAHLGNGFLRPATIKLLWTAQKTFDGKRTRYGIGWSVGKEKNGQLRVGHGGGSVGGSSQLVVFPKQRVILVITANMTRVGYGQVHSKIARSFLSAP